MYGDVGIDREHRHGVAVGAGTADELRAQRGLPDPRRAGEPDRGGGAGTAVEARGERGQLIRAVLHRADGARDRPPVAREHPRDERVDVHGCEAYPDAGRAGDRATRHRPRSRRGRAGHRLQRVAQGRGSSAR